LREFETCMLSSHVGWYVDAVSCVVTANLDVCAIISVQAIHIQATFVKYHKDAAFQKMQKVCISILYLLTWSCPN
jgi:hypothetical protein